LRREFDAVREWVATNNTFKPPKLSGPLLYLDSHKAWSQRLRPDATPKRQVKKLTAKELRQLVEAYRSMLDRSGGVITKWAQENGAEKTRRMAERPVAWTAQAEGGGPDRGTTD
jgi:hypothetical protein